MLEHARYPLFTVWTGASKTHLRPAAKRFNVTTSYLKLLRLKLCRVIGGMMCKAALFSLLKLAHPKARLLVEHIDLLRDAYAWVQNRYPFETVAVCVLPDHIHAVWTLPMGDDDYPLRWKLLKRRFSDAFPAAANRSESKLW